MLDRNVRFPLRPKPLIPLRKIRKRSLGNLSRVSPLLQTDRTPTGSIDRDSFTPCLSDRLSLRSRPKSLLEVYSPSSRSFKHPTMQREYLPRSLDANGCTMSAAGLSKGLKLFDVLYGPPTERKRPVRGKSRLPGYFCLNAGYESIAEECEPKVPRGKAATQSNFRDLVSVSSVKVGKSVALRVLQRMSLRFRSDSSHGSSGGFSDWGIK